MAKSYARIVSQIEKLQAEARQLARKRARAITTINSLIQKFEIEVTDLKLSARIKKRIRLKGKAAAKIKRRAKKVLPKYRGPGGLTWAGRGLMPVWLREAIAKGKRKEDFLIKKMKG